ncbi:hypothetical protein CQA49_08950 [Helicobacter sp. MIT 00-7814]|uniref:AAA family ATPase n=1 Tax=unclassified Helicobacter TaxID=2593540 RepID=UPI000E1F3297|nr:MULTISPECIES: ATP-binding protein [unclassified Helicobacter]RDU51956.1 hypothetical protein CQA49_08950 [Helicobacter sp. MIT 00-7814]RDU54126.1 hypothetical protein CQA37_05805 [Helicobacter sp. MIT 99-10781]
MAYKNPHINPFYYGGIVNAKHFCNRILEIKELKADIESGLNVLIYAPRRFGKTSFVLKTLKELDGEVKYVFLDLMHISSINEFISKYFNALAQELQEPTDKVIDFFKRILKIKPSISARFNDVGSPEFHLSFDSSDSMKTLEEVLDIPLHFAKEGKKIVIVFDEFQEISALGIESVLRNIIQQHSNQVSYIFMGSKKSLLEAMFSNKNKPFYKSVKHFVLREINSDSWHEFIENRFNEGGKCIEGAFIQKLLSITKGFPYYTQQFAYELWNQTFVNVGEENFNTALNIILEREMDLFDMEWSNLTANQRKALKIIIQKDGKSLYDEEFLVKYSLKIGSLQVALKALKEKDIVDKDRSVYYLTDPLFQYWVKKFCI